MRFAARLWQRAFGSVFLVALSLFPSVQAAAQWTATVGAQDSTQGHQVLAFLPNEIWIHAGDSIRWTLNTGEPHTITFLLAKQRRPPFFVGCPGFSEDPATYDGSTCVTTNILVNAQGLTVNFPKPGNYRIACLLHENMEGLVHVLDPSQSLPHDQKFYDAQAQREANALLTSRVPTHHHGDPKSVVVGEGEVVARPGGSQTLSVLRFMDENVTVHAGDTVEWNGDDPVTPHTITFGNPPKNPIRPSKNVTLDADGARHAILHTPGDKAHSGFIQASFQDRQGLQQAVPGATRFRVTFAGAGTYSYYCFLHGGLGMTGTVTVLP